MGGNALKNTELRRYNKAEYMMITRHVQSILHKNNIVAEPTLSYKNKPDFGDLDMLILSGTVKKNIRELIKEYFNPNEIYHNGNAWSFDFNQFQIDFIIVKDIDWVTSNVYFSYNDLGNFMGRIAYQMGFRYGDYGLKVNYYVDGKKFSKIISKEPNKIFEFLGFDWDKYSQSFHGLTDIFDFIINSRYFDSKIFDYEKLNHQNKTRNRKRKNYQLFLDYVAETASNKTYEYKSQDEYLISADRYFGTNIIDDIDEWKKVLERENEVHERFNGNIIMKLFDLKGKELGSSIKRFKSEIDYTYDSGFNEWILGTDQETIWNEFARINNVKNLKW
jgi:hypothetical protein